MGMRGVYREIDPPKRLVFTFRWGAGHEDGIPVETIVCVELTALSSEQTLLEFTQAGIKSPASVNGHLHGWTSSLDRLDGWLIERSLTEKLA